MVAIFKIVLSKYLKICILLQKYGYLNLVWLEKVAQNQFIKVNCLTIKRNRNHKAIVIE